MTARTKSQKNLLRDVLKMHNGGGVFHDLPPAEYSTQIVDDKKQETRPERILSSSKHSAAVMIGLGHGNPRSAYPPPAS